MGSVSDQIHNFISVAYTYQTKRTEKDMNQLQRQLQILSIASDLRVFETSSMESVQFYVCLENLLSSADVKSNLTWKIINLLTHLCKSTSIKIALRDEIQFLPVLTTILLDPKISPDKTTKTLQLMQDISYGIKLQHMHMWLQNVIPHLVELIKTSDGAADVLLSALATLNNLCRRNGMVVNILQGIEDHKKILQLLSRHKNASLTLQLLAAEVMFFIEADHSLVMSQVAWTISLVFKASVDGGDIHTIQLSSDILEEISSSPRFEEAVRKYSDFTTNIKLLMKNLHRDADPLLVACIFNVLSQVIKLDHPDIKALANDIIVRTLPWMFDKDSGLCAIKLINSIYTYCDEAVFTKHHDDLIGLVKNAINSDDNKQLSSLQLHRVNAMLKLVEEFCKKDATFKLKLAMAISPKLLFSLLDPMLEASERQFSTIQDIKSNLINNSLSSSSSGYDSLRVNQSYIHGHATNYSTADSHSTENLAESLHLLCSEVIVRILFVGKLLGKQKAEFMLDYDKMLSLPNIMVHLVRCSESKIPSLVTLSFQILCEGNIPKESLSSLIKAKVDYSSKNSEISVPESLPKDLSYILPRNQMHSASVVDKILNVLEQLRICVHENELKNLPLIDLMDMFNYAMSAEVRSQNSLQDALDSMDKYNRELKHSLLQAKNENYKLRYLLRCWEKDLETEKKNGEHLKSEVERIQNLAGQQRTLLLKDKTETERKLEKLKVKVSKLEHEMEGKNEELKRHLRLIGDSQNENKKLNKQLKEDKEANQRLQQNINKLEDEHRKHQRELEDQGKENQRLEKSVSQMKVQISELEMLISSHEQTIAEKDAAMEDLNKNNEALKRIQDMIHNISAGKS